MEIEQRKHHVRSEAARVAQKIDECHANDSVNVENQIGFLGRGDLLHFQRVI